MWYRTRKMRNKYGLSELDYQFRLYFGVFDGARIEGLSLSARVHNICGGYVKNHSTVLPPKQVKQNGHARASFSPTLPPSTKSKVRGSNDSLTEDAAFARAWIRV